MADLADLDRCATQIAQVVHESAPLPAWRQARMVVRSDPDGGTRSYQFVYTLEDGSAHKGQSPAVPSLAKLSSLVAEHRSIAQALAQPPWFEMAVEVGREGRYKFDFQYRDTYRAGDVVRGN